MRLRTLLLSSVFTLGWTVTAQAAPVVTVGSASGQAGTTVTIPLQFNPAPNNVASLQFNLTLPTGITTVAVTEGAILGPANKDITANRVGGTWQFIVFGLNQNTIAAGALMDVQVRIAPGTAAGAYTFRISSTSFSDPAGNPVTGGTSTNGTITVTAAPPTNQPPTVNAGANQTITLPATASLAGTASDDGLPNPPAALTTTWSRISGPGTISFANANNRNTTATFSQAGTHVLRLSVTDGALTVTDDVTITVNAAPTTTPPTLSVGSATGAAGSNVNLPISFNTGSASIAGMQFSLTLPTSLTTISVTTGTILVNANKSVTATRVGNRWNIIVFGMNSNTIASGSLLTAQVRIVPGTAAGTLSIPISSVTFTNPSGTTVTGGTSTGGSITVTAPANQGPTVNAGTDQTITLPTSSANLVGSASDDGLPNPPAALTTTWSRVSGPAAVTFGNANNRTTTATFTQAGTYVLRLTASDGSLSATDDVTIVVNPVANQRPTVNAGSDQTITLPTSSANLVGSASDDGLPNPPAALTTTWSRVSGPAAVTFGNANNRTTTVSFTQAGTYVLRLTASDSSLSATDDVTIVVNPVANQRPTVNAGSDQTITLPSSANLVGSASDDGLPNPPAALTTTWSWVSGPAAVTFGNANNRTTTVSFTQAGTYVLRLTASDSSLSATDDVTIVVNSGTPQNQAPAVNAGSDRTVVLPAAANLAGQAVDDGLPNPPGTLTITWSRVSGPGTIAFGNANALTTTATFSQAGTHVLRLTASDGALTTTDDMTVTVNNAGAQNQAPALNAGPDQTITLPAVANMVGAVIDDGLPTPPGAVTTTWSRVSGPGTITFGNANSLSTTATFSQAGTHIIRLTASDGSLSSVDNVTITVNSAGQTQNNGPIVNAGSNQIVNILDGADLAGIAMDDGLPNPPAQISYTWTMVSGPGTVTFGSASSASTTASFSVVGSYVLRLTASDGALSAMDTVTIVVTAAAPPQALISANPGIIIPGDAVTLSWITLNATSASLDQGIGVVNANGSRVVNPTQTTTYTLTASGTNGSVTTSVTVLVQTTPNTGNLPTPVLDFPQYVSVNGTLTANFPPGYGNIGFQWSIVRQGTSASSLSRGARVLTSRASSANFQTATNIAGLGIYGLEPGDYLVTVQAFNATGGVSATVQRAVTLVSADFSALRTFPNPWRSDRHAGQTVTIDGLPLGSTVKIFTVSGHFVKSLTPTGTPDTVTWDLTNDKGDKVASGIYLYLITVGDEKERGKIVIIK
jgi:hypothetical protein